MDQAAESPTPADDDTGNALLSLERLREAFAAMLGPAPVEPPADESQPGPGPADSPDDVARGAATAPDSCPISPESIVEAMLFVGRPDNGALSARDLARAMRDVSPSEVEEAIGSLNRTYDADDAAYRIVSSAEGYQLAIRPELERIGQKLHGRTRQARLSQSALEVLSLVAYHQPVKLAELDRLRQASSSAALSTLLRRSLVRLERGASAAEKPDYYTTPRFLRLFRLGSLEELPKSSDIGGGV